MTPIQSSTFIISCKKSSKAKSDQASRGSSLLLFLYKKIMKIRRKKNRKGKSKYLFLKYIYFSWLPLRKLYQSGTSQPLLKLGWPELMMLEFLQLMGSAKNLRNITPSCNIHYVTSKDK